ncbi:MAG TPA: hypothetical protein VE178_08570, partial [Silvibacterium sp.]|nr:hypothetical protein [Silvibacterium sp.]
MVALLLFAIPYNHADHDSPKGGAAQSQNPAQLTAPAPVQTTSGPALQNGSPQNKPPDEPKSVKVILPPKDDYDYISFWLGLTLAVVGIVGIGVAICTLCVIRRQTKATWVAAKASLRQADHLLASERAWLIIYPVNEGEKLKPGYAPMFYWIVENVGKTPAKLIETQAVCDAAESPQKLLSSPKFPQPVQLHQRILAPGNSMRFHGFWTQGVQSGEFLHFGGRVETFDTLSLLAYGYVKYLTVFGGDPCESRFCDDFLYFTKDVLTSDKDKTIV